MIQLHFHPSPNPMKVLLMLEETGLDYEPDAEAARALFPQNHAA